MRNAFQKANGTPFAGHASARRVSAATALLAGLFVGASACNFGEESGPVNGEGPTDGIGTSPSVTLPPLPPVLPTPPPAEPAPGGNGKPEAPSAMMAMACPIDRVVILGTEGDDILSGSSADECFVGVAGTDVIFGRGGRDVVLVAPGQLMEDGGDGEAVLLRAE